MNEKIKDYIYSNKEYLLSALAELVAIPSVKSEPEPGAPFGKMPRKALDKMLEICADAGFKTSLRYDVAGTADLCPDDNFPALGILCHLDVVPAAGQKGWKTDPFTMTEKNGILYGRGVIDDKGPLCAALLAMKCVKELGIPMKKGVRLIFGTDEENGSEDLEIYLAKDRLPENVFTPDASFPIINIEKGMMNASFELKGAGGHASAPPIHTAIGRLSKAVLDVENHPFKRQLAEPIAKMFDTLGRHSSFTYRLIFSNLWCFFPVLDMICKKSGGELNAMVRTTCAFTQASGSQAINVLPPNASVSANLRLLGTDTAEKAQAYLRSIVKDPDIQITNTYSMDPSRISVTEGPGWERLRNAILGTWTDAIYSPYLMLACSDSRHYGRISDRVYRFSAMAMSKEDRGMIHGNNERIRKEALAEAVAFYYRLMKQFD